MSGCAERLSGHAGEVKPSLKCQKTHPDHPVIHYADYIRCNMKITYINSTLIVQSITLLILSVPTIGIENLMRSRNNKFWIHHRSYIRTRRSLIGMPSYGLPLVRGWDNSISHLGSTASIGTSRYIPVYRLSIEELWCKNGPIKSTSLNIFRSEKYLSRNLWNAWLHDKKFL